MHNLIISPSAISKIIVDNISVDSCNKSFIIVFSLRMVFSLSYHTPGMLSRKVVKMNEYENIETVESVENDDQGSSVDVPGTDDPILSDSVSTESDMVQDAGSVTEEPPTESVDPGESGTNVYVMDSDGNYIPFTVAVSEPETEQVQVQNLSADDLEPYFSAINYRLDTIIFLLLSFWVIKRIKISVANMTGRSLDGRKDVLDR